MITKTDWDDALEAWADDERTRLGGSPTESEIRAYLNGELSANDAARVRALMVYDPALNARLRPPKSPRVMWLRFAATFAAGVIIGIVPFLMRVQPATLAARYEFAVEHTRGNSPTHTYLVEGKDSYVLIAHVDDADDKLYRVQLVRDADTKVLFDDSAQPDKGGAFVINVDGRKLSRGDYRIDISENGSTVQSYTFSVVHKQAAN